MPRTSVKTSYNLSDPEKALIARALHDAANRHVDPFDMNDRFSPDAALGRDMRGVLERLFPDFVNSFNAAAELQKALALGFLPPPGGATQEAVRTFLAQRETAREAKRPLVRPSRGSYTFDDSDLPF